jgi:hypothetical protein|nr:MAG TPA: hypothetical protein [Caudoviricetes sp.]
MKTVDEILTQKYISAKDLMIIIPELKYGNAIAFINIIQKEMEEKGLYIPIVKPKVALTKLVKKKLGL